MKSTTNCLMLLMPTVLMLAGCSVSEPVVAPTAFKNYMSQDAAMMFKCDVPEGWKIEGGGKKKPWAKFSSGSALIETRTDLVGSLVGDIAGAGSAMDDFGDEDLTPVAQVHTAGSADAASKFSGFKEIEDTAHNIQCSLGSARMSEFKAYTMSGSMHGYRTTILARDLRVLVYCTCNEKDWKTLQPAFERVIKSYKP